LQWSEEVAILWERQFDPATVDKLSIRFAYIWDQYNETLPVTIDDLLPSCGLNTKTNFGHEKEILDSCREQYLAQMLEAMSQI
jgi:hypothetical protein